MSDNLLYGPPMTDEQKSAAITACVPLTDERIRESWPRKSIYEVWDESNGSISDFAWRLLAAARDRDTENVLTTVPSIEARRTSDALRACDWSNTSIGTKAIVERAAQLLYAAPSAEAAVAPADEIEWLRAWLNTAQKTGIDSIIPIMRKRMQKLMIGKGDLCPRPSAEAATPERSTGSNCAPTDKQLLDLHASEWEKFQKDESPLTPFRIRFARAVIAKYSVAAPAQSGEPCGWIHRSMVLREITPGADPSEYLRVPVSAPQPAQTPQVASQDERAAQPWWHALAAAADAVERSADVWAGFSMQDAKVCVDAYLAASPQATTTQPAQTPQGNLREAFDKALRETWQMVDPLNPPDPGSYYRGQHEGIIAALRTIRDNFARTLEPQPAQ